MDSIGTELEEKVMAVAELSCADNETIYNMPFEVDSDRSMPLLWPLTAWDATGCINLLFCNAG